MAYRCVNCSKIYESGAKELMEGCECKGKLFFYIKEEKLKQILEAEKENKEILNAREKKQIEKDVREITGTEDESAPVFLDFESIAIMKPGKYFIDLQKIFSMKNPRIYRLEDGKYIVDLKAK